MTDAPSIPPAEPGNGQLVRRLFGLAWRYRLHCLLVLGIQLVLLTLGIGGLSFTGLGIDYIRHKLDGTPLGVNPLHVALPESWPPLQVLGLLAGFILPLVSRPLAETLHLPLAPVVIMGVLLLVVRRVQVSSPLVQS